MQIGGLSTSDPRDPAVADWWKKKADEIYRLIPDFGGFQIKANSEGQPGPQDYGANHDDGANMLAEALKPHGGAVLWRGMRLTDLTPELRRRMAVDSDTAGVVVIDVMDSSAAQRAAVRIGDVIERVAESSIHNVASFNALVRGQQVNQLPVSLLKAFRVCQCRLLDDKHQDWRSLCDRNRRGLPVLDEPVLRTRCVPGGGPDAAGDGPFWEHPGAGGDLSRRPGKSSNAQCLVVDTGRCDAPDGRQRRRPHGLARGSIGAAPTHAT